MERKLNTTMPRLSVGEVAPNFTLTDLNGDLVTRSAYRVLRHLVLLILTGMDAPTHAYIEELRDTYATIHAAEGEVLVLIAGPAANAESLRGTLDMPFHILLDSEGAVSKKFLPDDARYGVFVLDRYGALHTQWVLTDQPFPAVGEIVEWVEVIDHQCAL